MNGILGLVDSFNILCNNGVVSFILVMLSDLRYKAVDMCESTREHLC